MYVRTYGQWLLEPTSLKTDTRYSAHSASFSERERFHVQAPPAHVYHLADILATNNIFKATILIPTQIPLDNQPRNSAER